tara:strand:+ start:333 stop:518 length:186 start_codon:yes stop_codon:yes gene_type:complete
MTNTQERIKDLKNFALLDKPFKKWLTNCPKEYIWRIDEVTEDLERSSLKGTFTFRKIKQPS